MIVSGDIDQVQVPGSIISGLDHPELGAGPIRFMNKIISFLDFEASSLSNRSYPIEVAWTNEDASIESHLISPAAIEAWTDWDQEAERIHGIARPELVAHGLAPPAVCDRMIDQLAGKTIYTDAPRFDGAWLDALFSACGKDKSGIDLSNFDDLLVQTIRPDLPGRTQSLLTIEVLKQEARRQNPRRHRAAWDVEYLVKLWELARYHARR